MKKISLMIAILVSMNSMAQPDSSHTPFSISGYLEGYYSYDLNKPSNNTRPGFIYNYNRHNEFNINLGLIKATYITERVRAGLALATGTYMNTNYAAEPGTLKNIYEANAGYKLSKTKNLWLDMGIMPSHIGFESAIGKDNWTLTRSLVAENSPYFESGAKLSYTAAKGNLLLAAMVLNGWQRITRTEGNSAMSYGAQLFYKASDKLTFNYSTFIGTDKPDSARLWRYYHNVYAIFQFADKIGLTAGFDIGTEQKTAGAGEMNTWYAPVAILRYTPTAKWAMALRGEYFGDANGVIINSGTPNGFKTLGGSLNMDYMPRTTISFRAEYRYLHSKDAVFIKNNQLMNNNTAITIAAAIGF